jgi:hypothetical protein
LVGIPPDRPEGWARIGGAAIIEALTSDIRAVDGHT